ncbi:hypothetical protein Tco_1092856 [Tanacetum coccineum]|uniref:Retrotransposon gag domain-containing protein n=1 Tax=Tanacetum coccineum TaxID=301880 RepID=A0ABQ5IB20_9ASTR
MSSSSSIPPTECKYRLPLMTLTSLTSENPSIRFGVCPNKYMHLLLNTSQREELENELRSREELVVLQVEFADMEDKQWCISLVSWWSSLDEVKIKFRVWCFFGSSLLPWGSICGLNGRKNHEILVGGLGHTFWSLNEEISKYYSDNLYAISIKEDTTYLCMHFIRNHEELKSNTPYPEDSICRIEDYLKILEDIERDQSEGEVTETMTEPTMEEYMTKTRDGYGGSDNEDANEHIEKVLDIVDIFRIPNITQDQVMLLRKYCPPARTAKKMKENNNFQQDPDETLHQVWERFKELLLRCPQHYLTDMQEVISFYKGMDVATR